MAPNLRLLVLVLTCLAGEGAQVDSCFQNEQRLSNCSAAVPTRAGLPLQPMAKARSVQPLNLFQAATIMSRTINDTGKDEEKQTEFRGKEVMEENDFLLEIGSRKASASHASLSNQSTAIVGTSRGAATAISNIREWIRRSVMYTLIPLEGRTRTPDGDKGWNLFKSAPVSEWSVFVSVCVLISVLDMMVLQRLPSTFTVHCAVLVLWMLIAVLYGIALLCRLNEQAALEWFSGYILEWTLSMDNLFVFHLVIDAFKTPTEQVHKAVSAGIVGAVFIRMIFFMVVYTLLHVSVWIRFPFGLLLIWSGYAAAMGGDDDDDVKVEETSQVRIMKWMLGSRLYEGYDEQGVRAFVRGTDGKMQATLLFLVIAALECTDVIFALDSVSAKAAQIPNQYIAFSSSVLAMYGLRAMFFIVRDLVAMFELLQYGISLILVFIGVQLMMADYINMAAATSCTLIVLVFVVCVSGSVALRTCSGQKENS